MRMGERERDVRTLKPTHLFFLSLYILVLASCYLSLLSLLLSHVSLFVSSCFSIIPFSFESNLISKRFVG